MFKKSDDQAMRYSGQMINEIPVQVLVTALINELRYRIEKL